MTGATDKPDMPTHLRIDVNKDCINSTLSSDSLILFEQIRTIDRRRIIRVAGKLDEGLMLSADRKILLSLGIGRKTLTKIWSNIEDDIEIKEGM
jgi:mRNA interferase MazF